MKFISPFAGLTLTQVTRFTSLTSLPNSTSILDWLGNEIHGLFFSTLYRLITISNKHFFRIDVLFCKHLILS
jgi:hypothetical protein